VKSQQLARDNGEPTDDGSLLLKRLQVAENFAKSIGLIELDQSCWDRAGELEKYMNLDKFPLSSHCLEQYN